MFTPCNKIQIKHASKLILIRNQWFSQKVLSIMTVLRMQMSKDNGIQWISTRKIHLFPQREKLTDAPHETKSRLNNKTKQKGFHLQT